MPLCDELEREASALDDVDADVMATHFLDCWYDSANHDLMYYERMGAGDWPNVATRLAISTAAMEAKLSDRTWSPVEPVELMDRVNQPEPKSNYPSEAV